MAAVRVELEECRAQASALHAAGHHKLAASQVEPLIAQLRKRLKVLTLRRPGRHDHAGNGRSAEGSDGQTFDSGLLALSRVLEAHPADALLAAQSAAADGLRDAVRIICAEARAADPVRAERLLIALRGGWHALPPVRRIPNLGVRQALWDRMVRLCVEEFYAPTGAPTPRVARPGATTAA